MNIIIKQTSASHETIFVNYPIFLRQSKSHLRRSSEVDDLSFISQKVDLLESVQENVSYEDYEEEEKNAVVTQENHDFVQR